MATTTSASTGGSSADCSASEPGDPCDKGGESCPYSSDCGTCTLTCEDGTWSVRCTGDEPECREDPVGWGRSCDDLCGPFSCDYEVETPCGLETLTAECGDFGWTYVGDCLPDCREALDEDACEVLLDCVWVVPCEGSDITEPRCASLGAPPGEGGIVQAFCDDDPCPEGMICRDLGVNQTDFPSGDCSGSGSIAALCDPAPER